MKTVRFSFAVVGVLGLGLLAAACTAAPEESSEDVVTSRDDVSAALAQLPDAKIVAVDDDGVPTFLSGNLGQTAPGLLRSNTGADLAPVLATVTPVFRTTPDKLSFRSSALDPQGDQHYRFGATRKGKAVIGAELLVHVRNGKVYAANGNVRDDLAEPAAATLSADQAASAAKAATKIIGATAKAEGKLSYFHDGSKLQLVHPIEVTGEEADGTPVRDTVLVNAADGSIALRQPHIFTAKSREMHDAQNGYSTPGPLVRKEGAAPVSDKYVNDNYDRLGATYDCYKELFGRDSYDDHGAKLVSSVHYQRNYVNAYWDGTQMVYGDGDGQEASNLAESMDVTAHELTHAVTERTSNLNYSGQSGGLNEAMSDIMGATCDWYFMGKGAVNPIIWVIGHDIWTPNGPSDDGLRYMNNPHKDGDSIDFAGDYSGQDVHYTSGVPNLAYALLVSGGTHPRNKTNVQVTGIGIEKAAKVFYRANTSIMTSSSNYAAARTACEQAAQQLGLSADEIKSVSAAWAAVGVGSAPGGTTGGGTSSSSSSSSSTSGSTGGSCRHDVCSSGTKLPTSCDSCVADICAADSYCCNTKWDATCVREVGSVCGQSCGH
jgi:vibriolysin